MFTLRTGLRSSFLLVLLAALGACGGGGGGSSTPTTPSTATFPIAAAFNNVIINGFQASLIISGKASGVTVNGTGTIVYARAVAATFEGQAGLAQTQTFSGTVTGNGVTVPLNVSDTIYYDSNYNELGDIDSGGEYSVATAWHPLPTAAHVNDAGDIDAITSYTDQTKSTVSGSATSAYTIDADSATSVILHVTVKVYDENHALTETDQYRYRIDTAGNINFVSADTTEDSSNTIHFAAQ